MGCVVSRAGLAHRSRDEIDRRRVLVSPNAAALIELVGAVYARIGQRWNDYLATLTEDQIAQTIQVIQHATAVNREEVEWLRTTARKPASARTPRSHRIPG
jgi:DNA-binding MarR family transcriptional regulator